MSLDVPLRQTSAASDVGSNGELDAPSDVGGSVDRAASDVGGRPKKRRSSGSARSEVRQAQAVVTARMLPETRDQLVILASKAGLGPSAFAARILIDEIGLADETQRQARPVDPEALLVAKRLLGELGKIGGLLKSLKGVALDQGMPAILPRLDEALTPLRALHAELAQVTDALARPPKQR